MESSEDAFFELPLHVISEIPAWLHGEASFTLFTPIIINNKIQDKWEQGEKWTPSTFYFVLTASLSYLFNIEGCPSLKSCLSFSMVDRWADCHDFSLIHFGDVECWVDCGYEVLHIIYIQKIRCNIETMC